MSHYLCGLKDDLRSDSVKALNLVRHAEQNEQNLHEFRGYDVKILACNAPKALKLFPAGVCQFAH